MILVVSCVYLRLRRKIATAAIAIMMIAAATAMYTSVPMPGLLGGVGTTDGGGVGVAVAGGDVGGGVDVGGAVIDGDGA